MEKYISNCLESLLIDDSRLLKNLEILVINDGSKDRSSEIAHAYQMQYPDIIKVIDKDNGNYGSCINRGIREATGRYIKILDADDSFDTRGLSDLIDRMKCVDVDLFLSDYVLVSENREIKERRSFNIPEETVLTISDIEADLFNIQMHGVAYKSQNIKNIEYTQTEGISYTDQEWIFYPMQTVVSVYYYPEVVYRYLVGRNGQTVELKTYHKKVIDRIVILKRMLSWYREKSENFDNLKNSKYLTSKIIELIHSAYISCLIVNRDIKLAKDIDQFIHDMTPDLYEYSDNINFHKHCHHKFIKHWRKSQKLPSKLLTFVYSTLKNVSVQK